MEDKMVGISQKTEPIREIFNYNYGNTFDIEDIKLRRLYINSEIDEEILESIVYHILRYNRIDKDTPTEDRKPIIIYINTPGGSVTDGFSLIDAILNSKTPIYTVNLGIAYSMGFLTYIAGERRYSMPSSTYLCHDGSSMAWDSMSKLKDRVEFETGQMEQHTRDYIISRTNITKEKYLENLRKEWYFYSTEAKELGVTTHIVGEDCTIDDIL